MKLDGKDLLYKLYPPAKQNTAKPLVCADPENCTEMHNEENSDGETHHYGCGCDDCMQQYWLLKH